MRRRRTASALFDAAAATRTLPLVERVAADAGPLARDLADRRARLAWVRRTPGGKRQSGGPLDEELEDIQAGIDADAESLAAFADEIRLVGAVLRDPATGLVEFPGPRNGRDGFYSWRPGEEAVTHWRPAAADPADRAPVRPLVEPADAPAPAELPEAAGL